MARPTYGPQPQKRARRLLEALLAFANDEFEDCDLLYSKIKINWQTSTQLVVRTQVRYLTLLTAEDTYTGKLTADNVKEGLKRYKDYLEILEDNRTSTQGASDWHFTLFLWHPRYESWRNLERFDQEWQQRRPIKSQQATAADADAPTLSAPIRTSSPPPKKGNQGQHPPIS